MPTTYPTHTPLLHITVVPTAPIAAKRFVGFNHTQATPGIPCMGVSDYPIEANKPGSVIYAGTAIVETGAAIDGTVPNLKADAQGRAVPVTAGTDVIAGILKKNPDGTYPTAAGAGEFLEVYVVQKV